jgi:hypothetical protein
MATTTDVVRIPSFWDTYRRHGYFFREVAMLTILIGFGMHLYRMVFANRLHKVAAMSASTCTCSGTGSAGC